MKPIDNQQAIEPSDGNQKDTAYGGWEEQDLPDFEVIDVEGCLSSTTGNY